MKLNIAIDGPSGAGKSSIAKILAKKLNYVHIDTGAMYRCVAYKAYLSNVSFDNEADLVEMLQNTKIALTSDGRVFLDNKDVSAEIRTNEMSLGASSVSRHALVRERLVYMQQQMALDKGVIMDGRDIGTVVLTDAEVKIYLTASSLERAKRRYQQNIEANIPTEDIEMLKKQIEERDYQDTHRKASPLKKAEDAIEIDSSYLSIDEVVDEILNIVEKKVNHD